MRGDRKWGRQTKTVNLKVGEGKRERQQEGLLRGTHVSFN